MIEEKKTIFSYIGQALATYGTLVFIFSAFSMLLGDKVGDYSSLFALGSKGMTMPTLIQLFFLAIALTVIQVAFLTDVWISNITMLLRKIFFFLTVLAVLIFMIIVFKWFPVDDPIAWIGFFGCFIVSMTISTIYTKLWEKEENKRMQEALDKYNKQ